MSAEKEHTYYPESDAASASEEAPNGGAEAVEHDNGALPGEPGKLIPFAERERGFLLARDINLKIDELEKHFDTLTKAFSQSQDSLKTNLAKLHSRNLILAADIERASSRIEENAEMQFQATKVLDQRLQQEMSDLSLELNQAGEALRAQQLQLEQLQSGQQTLDELQSKLASLAERQGAALELLSVETQAQNERNQSQFEGLHSLHSEQKLALQSLMENFDALALKTEGLAGGLSQLDAGVATHKLETRKNTRILAGVLGTVAVLLIASFVYLQFFPNAVPQSVRDQLASLSGDVSAQSESISGLLTSLAQLREQFASLDSGLLRNGEEDAALRAQVGASGEQLAKLQADLTSMQRSVDDLQFRVFGPTNRGASSLAPVLELHDGAWLSSLPADHYSIQLVGVYRKDGLVAFINQNASVLNDRPLAFNAGTHLGRDWFNLFYGNFASFDEAQAALESLPLRLRGNNPWVRSLASIQKVSG